MTAGHHIPALVVAVLLGALALPAHAAAPGERRLEYAGFGTLGLVYHEREGIGFRRSESQARSAEAGELDYETDTLAGIQLNGAWNADLDAVVQAVTRLSADGDWRPQLTRAALRYVPAANLRIHAGRIGWKIFPRADSRHIGYSQLTIRPPMEVFGYIPTDHFDGAQLDWIQPLGSGLFGINLYGGTIDGTLVRRDGSSNTIDGSAVWGGHLEYTIGAWVLRAGTGVVLLDERPDYGALEPGLRQTGEPAAVAFADTLANGDRGVDFIATGAAYDSGPVQARLFLGRTDIENIAGPDVYSGSLLAGYRIGSTSPYLAAAFIQNQKDRRRTGLPDTPEYAALNAGALAAQAPTRYNQHSIGVGLRHDFAAGLALKLQIDRLRLRDSTLHFDRRSGNSHNTDLTVFGLALDFIW